MTADVDRRAPDLVRATRSAIAAVIVTAGLAVATFGTVGAAAHGGSAFEQQMAEMPASILEAEAPLLTYVDMALVWDRLGVGDDPQERIDALPRTIRIESYAQPTTLFRETAFDTEGARAEVGFSIVEIERELAVVAPPRRVVIAETTVSADDVVDALETDPVWSADLEEVETDHGPYYAWGADGLAQDLTRRSAFRPLGQGGQLALTEVKPATVVRTLDAADMDAALATAAGVEPSALDAGPFAAIDEALDGATVVQAIGVPGTTRPGDTGTPPLGPYLGIVVVEVLDSAGVHTEILVFHDSPEAASANAEIADQFLGEGTDVTTHQPISTLLPDAAVSVDDSVLVVTVDGIEGYRIASQMLVIGALLPVA